jgi:hypothetical protein
MCDRFPWESRTSGLPRRGTRLTKERGRALRQHPPLAENDVERATVTTNKQDDQIPVVIVAHDRPSSREPLATRVLEACGRSPRTVVPK